MLPLFILMIRRIVSTRRNAPDELFAEALKNENSGQFEAAIITYERALGEVKKAGFQNGDLKNNIIEKLKVLNTVIGYQNGFHAGR